MIIKLSDYILEQSISDASASDIALEQAKAEVEVSMFVCEAYIKQINISMVMEANDSNSFKLDSELGFVGKVRKFIRSIINFVRKMVIKLMGWISEKRVGSIIKKLALMSDEEKNNTTFVLPSENIADDYQLFCGVTSGLIKILKEPSELKRSKAIFNFKLNDEDSTQYMYGALSNVLHGDRYKSKFTKDEVYRYTYDEYFDHIRKLYSKIKEYKNEMNECMRSVKTLGKLDYFNVTDEAEAKKLYNFFKNKYTEVYSEMSGEMIKLIRTIKQAEKIVNKNPDIGLTADKGSSEPSLFSVMQNGDKSSKVDEIKTDAGIKKDESSAESKSTPNEESTEKAGSAEKDISNKVWYGVYDSIKDELNLRVRQIDSVIDDETYDLDFRNKQRATRKKWKELIDDAEKIRTSDELSDEEKFEKLGEIVSIYHSFLKHGSDLDINRCYKGHYIPDDTTEIADEIELYDTRSHDMVETIISKSRNVDSDLQKQFYSELTKYSRKLNIINGISSDEEKLKKLIDIYNALSLLIEKVDIAVKNKTVSKVKHSENQSHQQIDNDEDKPKGFVEKKIAEKLEGVGKDADQIEEWIDELKNNKKEWKHIDMSKESILEKKSEISEKITKLKKILDEGLALVNKCKIDLNDCPDIKTELENMQNDLDGLQQLYDKLDGDYLDDPQNLEDVHDDFEYYYNNIGMSKINMAERFVKWARRILRIPGAKALAKKGFNILKKMADIDDI